MPCDPWAEDSDAGSRALRTGVVTERFGQFGILLPQERETRRAEFELWLRERKTEPDNLFHEISPSAKMGLMDEFCELYNCAVLTSKKYYDLNKYHSLKNEKYNLKRDFTLRDDELV